MLGTDWLFDSFLQDFRVVFLDLLVVLKLVRDVDRLVGKKGILILQPLNLAVKQHLGLF